MKKIILAAVVAVSSLSANAQVWLGGSLGFNYNKAEAKIAGVTVDVKTTKFSIAPEIGYTLSDKWDIALALEESYASQKDGESMNSFSVNPYARWTFAKSGKVSFFLDGGFKVGVQNNFLDDNNVIQDVDDDITVWGIGVRPGIKFAASDKVSLVASFGGLGFQQTKWGDFKDSDLGFNVDGNALKFGFYYTF